MSEEKKKRLNKKHPDCSVYTEKFYTLWNAYFDLVKREEEKYPDRHALGHPADKVLRPAYMKLSEDIKALQQEYSYLFTGEYEEEQKDNQGKANCSW